MGICEGPVWGQARRQPRQLFSAGWRNVRGHLWIILPHRSFSSTPTEAFASNPVTLADAKASRRLGLERDLAR